MSQVMSFIEMRDFLAEQFPQGDQYGVLEALGDGWSEMHLPIDEQHLRPGGTVSGPAMMALADVAMYAALLSKIGPVALAVTTNLNINFLRKPKANMDIVARAEILKVGNVSVLERFTLAHAGKTTPLHM